MRNMVHFVTLQHFPLCDCSIFASQGYYVHLVTAAFLLAKGTYNKWKRISKSRKENPQKMTQLSPRSHPRHLVGKRTAQKDAIKDITSDSQVNSYFPYRWSPASLTVNIYFYLFLYLYITRITINNGTPHLKSLKSQNRRAA